MSLKSSLGNRIQELRKLIKLSQEELAEKIGIDRTSLAKIEAGKNYPKPETLEKIKTVLDVRYSDLFNFENTEDNKLNNIKLKLSKLNKKELDFINSLLNAYIISKK